MNLPKQDKGFGMVQLKSWSKFNPTSLELIEEGFEQRGSCTTVIIVTTFLISTAGYDICWHIRGCGEGSDSQLLFLLDMPSVCTCPRPLLWLGPHKQDLREGLQRAQQSVSSFAFCLKCLLLCIRNY